VIVWDFTSILFMLTVGTGLIILMHKVMSRSGFDNITLSERRQKDNILLRFSKSFFPVFAFVFILRGFVVEPFRIPSGSMIPTLLVGDFILVNKYQYGLKSPIFNSQLINMEDPQRGDVVVFKYPLDPSTPFIKRVIGLPGDNVRIHDNHVYVNGKEIAWQNENTYIGIHSAAKHTGSKIHQELTGDQLHQVLISPGRYATGGDFDVPLGQYFVLGDNRDNSRDSRFWGFVPEENLMGKAFYIWFNWDGGPNFSRAGNNIE
jgi:signal peptidase I